MTKQIRLDVKLLSLIVMSFFSVSACSTLDKISHSEFYPYEQVGKKERYTFKATADLQYPPDSKNAEQIRMEWLQQWVSDNKLCVNGYTVDNRKQILNNKITRIYYVITCS